MSPYDKLLAPIYRVNGHAVTFESPADGDDVSLTVIDDTTDVQFGSLTQIDTTRPAFRARVSDLDALEILPAAMIGVEVTWRDRAYKVRSAVNNPLDGAPGEILFILQDA